MIRLVSMVICTCCGKELDRNVYCDTKCKIKHFRGLKVNPESTQLDATLLSGKKEDCGHALACKCQHGLTEHK